MGAGRRLRELNPAIKLISVQPDSPLHGLEGLKHMETAIVPGIYDPALADEDLRVAHRGRAYDLTRRLAREEGLLVGISSGANARRRAGRRRGTDSDAVVVVMIFRDGGENTCRSASGTSRPMSALMARAPRGRRRRSAIRRTARRPIRTSAAAR